MPSRLALAVALALAAPAARAQPAFEFEEEDEAAPSIALGPVPDGAHLALDVGWLRSGARVDIGLARGFDLTLRAETLSPDPILGDQSGGFAGLRFSPFSGPGLRLTLAGELGLLLVPLRVGSRELLALRGEVILGYPLLGVLPYVRGAARGLRYDTFAATGWDADIEGGAGVERAFGRVLLGAEASVWKQQQVKALTSWRLRVGYAF